jgi:DHA1 family bicyclomycin/chloramphenicol resistance-like MFS transporter
MSIRPASFTFTVLLAGMAALASLAIDMSLPALPILEREFHASAGQAGLTLSLFMAGFASAQLVLGPLSDRIGRRPVLLGAVGLFGVSALLCAVAPSMRLLNAARFLQGTGAAAGMAMSLAIVRDLFIGVTARVKLSYVAMVVGIAPIIGPSLGSLLLQVASWRAIFGLHAVAGFGLVAAVAFGLRETRPVGRKRPGVVASYIRMLTTRRAVAYAVANAFSFGCMFSYISGSPLLLMGQLHVSTSRYGLLFACTAGSITFGSWLNGLLSSRRVPGAWLLGSGLVLSLSTCVALSGLSVWGPLTLLSVMPLLMINMLCRGLVGPHATLGALEPMPEVAGVAAAVTGFLQMIGGALASAAVAGLYPALGSLAMSGVMSVCAVGALLFWRLAVWRTEVRPAASLSGKGAA